MEGIKWILKNDIALVQYLALGYSMLDVAESFSTTIHAVRKRLDRIRKTNGYATNMEMVADFMRKKIIK